MNKNQNKTKPCDHDGNPIEYWDKRQAAKYLGVCDRTLDVWMADGKIPYLKIGKTCRFRRDLIDKHLETKFGVGI